MRLKNITFPKILFCKMCHYSMGCMYPSILKIDISLLTTKYSTKPFLSYFIQIRNQISNISVHSLYFLSRWLRFWSKNSDFMNSKTGMVRFNRLQISQTSLFWAEFGTVGKVLIQAFQKHIVWWRFFDLWIF